MRGKARLSRKSMKIGVTHAILAIKSLLLKRIHIPYNISRPAHSVLKNTIRINSCKGKG